MEIHWREQNLGHVAAVTASQWWETPLWVNSVFFLNVLFSCRDYLADYALWEKCTSPDNIVPWHLTLFSLLLVMSGIQGVLCGIQVVNGLFGTICGDCKCCGCCGVSSWRLSFAILCTDEVLTPSSWQSEKPNCPSSSSMGTFSNKLPKPYIAAIRK